MSTVVDQPRPEGSETNKKLGLFKNNVDFESAKQVHRKAMRQFVRERQKLKVGHQNIIGVKAIQKKLDRNKKGFLNDSKLNQIEEEDNSCSSIVKESFQ